MAADVYPLPHYVKAIGTPYTGTHGKAFNRAGGSDNWESENAIDLPTPLGTPVYAVAAGTIGPQIGSLGSSSPRMAGLRLHLVTANNEFYYTHLSRLVVKAGERVQAGQLLGYSGSANGVAHLHIAAKNGDPRQAFGVDLPAPAPSAPPTDTTAAQTADASAGPIGNPAPPPAAPAEKPIGSALPAVAAPTAVGGSAIADLWRQVTKLPQVSPETQQLAGNAVLATGG